MSLIAERKKEQSEAKGLFICLAGPRFGGKTTTLGTLEGKTLLINIAAKESGCRGAINMAKKLDNSLDAITGRNCNDVTALVKEAITEGYDNIAVDGISALTEAEFDSPGMVRAMKSDVWAAFRTMSKTMRDFVQGLKEIAEEHPINIVVTAALVENTNNEGVVTSTDLFAKGKVTEQEINSRCPIFVVSRLAPSGEDGDLVRILQTYDDGVYHGRMDGVFEGDNPKAFRSDPAKVEPGQPVGLAALIAYLKEMS